MLATIRNFLGRTPPCKTNLLKYEHTYSCVQTCANVYQRIRKIYWAIFDPTDMKISLYKSFSCRLWWWRPFLPSSSKIHVFIDIHQFVRCFFFCFLQCSFLGLSKCQYFNQFLRWVCLTLAMTLNSMAIMILVTMS